MKPRFCGTLWCAMLLAGMVSGLAYAQSFDAAAYTALADARSDQSIPIGTKISLANWQKYRQFMAMGMQALFGGKYLWKIGPGPEFTMVVGPTTHFKPYRALQLNTEKYAQTSRLEKVASGGYTLKGYVAGTPFPNPSGPLAAYEIVYNDWTCAAPWGAQYFATSNLVDRYHNDFVQQSRILGWRLSHLSDDSYPVNADWIRGYLSSSNFFLLAPEQVRYTAEVALLPEDPEKLQEAYVFVPSLRRALRLSEAAHCAPLLGSDFIEDDVGDGVGFILPYFEMKLLGEKRILAMANPDPRNYANPANFDLKSAPGWPSPAVTNWELRDEYVVDVAPLPRLGRYCYGHKVLFIDKEVWFNNFIDVYDANGTFWKHTMIMLRPVALNTGEKFIFKGLNQEVIWDFQNSHVTASVFTPPAIDKDCEGDCQQPEIYALPGGLVRIMR